MITSPLLYHLSLKGLLALALTLELSLEIYLTNLTKFFEMLPTSPSIITITLNSSIATN